MPLLLDIVTPERRVISVECDEVQAHGVLGGFGIRPGHTPFMSALDAGRLAYSTQGKWHEYAVGGGFLQVVDNRVTVLADTAEAKNEIDVPRAERTLREAEERLRTLTEQDGNYKLEAARLRRSTARLNVAR